MLGGRISYCNWLIKSTDDIQLRNSSANFHEITAKISHVNDNILLRYPRIIAMTHFRLQRILL